MSKSSVEASRRTVSSGGPIIPQQPMGAPLLGLTEEQLARFFVGREQFDRTFTVEEGLGPVFNQNSCGSCHGNPLGGPGSITVTRAGRLEKGGFDPLTELGGSLFQQEAIDDACAEVVPEEANVIAFRVTNGMMGYGLVEAIPDSAILANADPVDVNGDGISGKAVIVSAVEDNLDHVGRFGWKADAASMITFSAGASLNEMGMTNYYKPTDQDPNGINPPELGDCDTVADYEIGIAFILQLADFQRFLTAAPQTPKSGMTGEALFVSIGCSDCHIPAFTTPDDPGLEDALRNKEIRQYTDYLVHDAGLAADFIAEGEAGQREIKTAPLAGIRTRDPMWHDGRVAAGTFADRMRAAIACHCAIFSEAGASAERFLSGTVAECPDSLTVPGSGFQCEPGEVEGGLNDEQRDAVIAFLDSLGRREFDADGENGVLVDDFTNMLFCSEIGVPITPDHECAIHDIDQNGIIDGSDFESFLLAFDGELIDCNCNGTNDLADIFFGQSPDGDGDGVPDECLPGDPPVCINLEFRPPSQSVLIGDTVSIGLYAVSDDETDASLTAAQVIISWDPSLLRLLGNDGTGAVPLLSSGFPPNDPFNLNEVVPPQDGDGLYVALAPLGNTVPTTPEGVLLTTFQFLALADTPQTPVDILDSGGDPLGETIVFDGTVPNLDVTGTLIGSVVDIIFEPPPDPTLLLTAVPSSAQIGDPVVVTLSMLNLGSNQAAEFQAFLSFDSTQLMFISGSYTPEPFGLPIILPIEADGGNIDLAAVINVFGGQSPTSVDAEL
ncbi:MAG: hypothetical protein O7D91_19050, partial [Planctomycetota bacterium]|nr:hypothetical protein [Planctomycetota bacterium]